MKPYLCKECKFNNNGWCNKYECNGKRRVEVCNKYSEETPVSNERVLKYPKVEQKYRLEEVE